MRGATELSSALPGVNCEVPALTRLETVCFCFPSSPAEAMGHTMKWGTLLPKRPCLWLSQLLVLAGLFHFCSGKQLPGT